MTNTFQSIHLGGSRWLLAGLLWITISFDVQARTYTITDFGDDQIDNGNCTLREAIRAANTDTEVDGCSAGSVGEDKIILLAGTYTQDLSDGLASDGEDNAARDGDLDILDDLVIEGVAPEYTIIEGLTGQSEERVFDIRNARVRMRGLTVQGGRALGDSGGNIQLLGGSLRLIDVLVRDGRALNGGGVSVGSASSLLLQRGRIAGNHADNFGGGIIHFDGSLRLEDSELAENVGVMAGGAIYSNSTLTVYRSALRGNHSDEEGGAIYALQDCDIQYSHIDQNDANQGGGIWSSAEPGVFCVIQQSAITNNIASQNGGGLFVGGDTVVRRTTFAGNRANQGGGIYSDSANALLDHVTIANNLSGGGIYNESGLFSEVSLFANNIGGNCLGNPFDNFGAYNLDDGNTCQFVDSPNKPSFPNTEPLLGPLHDNGGPTPTLALLPGSPAIDVVSTAIQTGCESAPDQRGYPRGRPRLPTVPDPIFLCDIGAYEVVAPHRVNSEENLGDMNFADDICLTTTGTCTLRAAIEQTNQTPGFEEVELPRGTYRLMGFASNPSTLELTEALSIRGEGAAVTVIDGNQQGAIFNIGLLPELPGAASLAYQLHDVTLTGGRNQGPGGAVNTAYPLLLERVWALDNQSENDGGAVFCENDCWLSIVDSELGRNQATGHGGAIFQQGSGAVMLERSVVHHNSVESGSGGAGEVVRLWLSNSLVHGNQAGSAGAWFASQAVIEDSTIARNAASDTGGIFLLNLSVVRNSIVAENINALMDVPDNCSLNPNALHSAGHNLSNTPLGDCRLTDSTDQVDTLPRLIGPSVGIETAELGLESESPAIDSGDNNECPAKDYRGVNRPLDGDGDGTASCDIGAYEFARSDPPPGELLFSDGFES